jgi:hypothetical protein
LTAFVMRTPCKRKPSSFDTDSAALDTPSACQARLVEHDARVVAGEQVARCDSHCVHPRRETDDQPRGTRVAERRYRRCVIPGKSLPGLATELRQPRTTLAVEIDRMEWHG